MRAATTLVSLLQQPIAGAMGAATPSVWRAGELAQEPVTVASGFSDLDRELPGGGWPLGRLIELLLDLNGIGELSLIATALARISTEHRACVWVLPADATDTLPSLPYAPALAEAGIDPAHSIFVKPATPRESLWACEQALRATHLGALIAWLPQGSADADFRALRRLHLLAAQRNALVFVLRSTRAAATPSPAVLRVQLIHGERGLQVALLKRRGRPLLDPLLIDLHPAHWADVRVAAPARVDQPASATPSRSPLLQAALTAQRWSMKAIFSH
jgi:hypothetical protein